MTARAAPFIVDVPDAVLDDVARRLTSTVWRDDPNNEDWRYGVNARSRFRWCGCPRGDGRR